MLKIIIAGSRDFDDYALVKSRMAFYLSNQKLSDVEIVSGGARGADALGERLARDFNLKLKIFPADWEKHGKKAGYLRNEQMAQYADCLVAFWDGESRGTKHMIDLANGFKLKVRVVEYLKDKRF